MARKMCSKCRLSQNAAGKQQCYECLMMNAPPEIREVAADRRLRMIPEELRRDTVPRTSWPIGRRWCSGCQSFPREQDCIGSRCGTCAGRASHARMIEKTYTIHGRPFTPKDFKILFEKQGGVCPICLRPSRTKRLAIDHDHQAMDVRGLLCPGEWGCNLGVLGRIKDVAMARRIVAYLENPPAPRWIPE